MKKKIPEFKRRRRPRNEVSVLVQCETESISNSDDATLPTVADTSLSSTGSLSLPNPRKSISLPASLRDVKFEQGERRNKTMSLRWKDSENEWSGESIDKNEENQEIYSFLKFNLKGDADLLIESMNLHVTMRSTKRNNSFALRNEISKRMSTAINASKARDEKESKQKEKKSKSVDVPLPSSSELSNELCKVIAAGCGYFSDWDSINALGTISNWAQTQDVTFLEHFLNFGGVSDILILVEKCLVLYRPSSRRTIDEEQEEIAFMVDCLRKSASVLCNISFNGRKGTTTNLPRMIATEVIECNGMQILLLATEACLDVLSKKDNDQNRHGASFPIEKESKRGVRSEKQTLQAIESLWNVIMNVYCNAEEIVTEQLSTSVLDSCISVLDQATASSVFTHSTSCEALANVFNVLYRILTNSLHYNMIKQFFEKKEILSHCLKTIEREIEFFQSLPVSSESAYIESNSYESLRISEEALLEEAIIFFQACCKKNLLNTTTKKETQSKNSHCRSEVSLCKHRSNTYQKFDLNDHSRLTLICVAALEDFPRNRNIRAYARKILRRDSLSVDVKNAKD